MTHNILSTSNCGNPSLRLFGFGPVVPDGFGIGYLIKVSDVETLCFSICISRDSLSVLMCLTE